MGSQHVLHLASGSPRRAQLLGRLSIEFDVTPIDVAEPVEYLDSPWQTARRLSLLKLAAARRHFGLPALTADTVVDLDGVVLGKPVDTSAAASMLEQLCGRWHQVHTGVAVQARAGLFSGVATTRVLMRRYTRAEIEAYIRRGEPFDKAGGYAIQDALFRPVEAIEGSWTNVVGLPLEMTGRLLRQAGYATRIQDEACGLTAVRER